MGGILPNLPPKYRTGIGKQLMNYLADTAEHIPSVQKVMLTCFVCNTHALAFYHKLGYTTDDFSPRPRKLRGGKVVTPDYVVLSRSTVQSRPSKPASSTANASNT